MKKQLIIVYSLVAIATGVMLCAMNAALKPFVKWPPEVPNTKTSTATWYAGTHASGQSAGILCTIEHDGHKFIVEGARNKGAIIHHPSCQCLSTPSYLSPPNFMHPIPLTNHMGNLSELNATKP